MRRTDKLNERGLKPALERMDKILISAIDCVANIGVTTEERTIKQRLYVTSPGVTGKKRARRAVSLIEHLSVLYAEPARGILGVWFVPKRM